MPNPFFQFKQFTVFHDRCAMKVTTDSCLFGAWVAQALPIHGSSQQMLDIGTGTGLLSLMVAQKTGGTIDAIEIEQEAAVQAAENCEASLWKEKIKVITANIIHWSPELRYDVIFTNPPFYERDLKSPDSLKNKAHHNEGLPLQDLAACIGNHLKGDGVFFILFPATRYKQLLSYLLENGLYVETLVWVQQTPRHSPFRVMLKGSRNYGSLMQESTVVIRKLTGEYTPDFILLLQDYYLYLSMAS